MNPAKKYLSNRYTDYEFDDETSQFDPKGIWQAGSEYYKITIKCRVPVKMLRRAMETHNDSELEFWITNQASGPDSIYYD